MKLGIMKVGMMMAIKMMMIKVMMIIIILTSFKLELSHDGLACRRSPCTLARF